MYNDLIYYRTWCYTNYFNIWTVNLNIKTMCLCQTCSFQSSPNVNINNHLQGNQIGIDISTDYYINLFVYHDDYVPISNIVKEYFII